MTSERKKTIGVDVVEEIYWAGRMVVYINNRLTDESFNEAVKRLEDEQRQYHNLETSPVFYEKNEETPQ